MAHFRYSLRLLMRVSYLQSRGRLMLAILAAAGLAAATAQAQSEAKTKDAPIHLSEPSSPLGTSNLIDSLNPGLERLNPTPSSFRQVQEDLFGSLANSLNSVDSMQGVLSLPQAPRPQLSRHARELMDQRKNWAFADFKDLYPEPTAEDMLGVKQSEGNGLDKLSTSLIQKFYENSGEKMSGDKNKPGQEYDPTGMKQYSGTNGLQALTRSFPSSDQFTKLLFSGGPDTIVANPEDNQSAVTDADGLQASQQKRFLEFRRMLDPNQTVNGFSGGLEATTPGEVARRAAINEPYRSSISPMLGIIDPTRTALHTHVDDDPTAAALGLPNPAPYSPPAKPPQTIQQMLDPFGSHMPKPKY